VSLSLHFTHEVRLERTGRVVPLEAFAVAVPQLQTVLLFAVLVLEVVGFAGVPVGEGYGTAGRHPEEVALVGQVRAGGPEVLVPQPCKNRRSTFIFFHNF
jgi:hypothetical protein